MVSEVDPIKIQVTGIDPNTFDQVRLVAKRFGAVADAAIVRFALEQFCQGKSIRDFESPTTALVEGDDDSDALS